MSYDNDEYRTILLVRFKQRIGHERYSKWHIATDFFGHTLCGYCPPPAQYKLECEVYHPFEEVVRTATMCGSCRSRATRHFVAPTEEDLEWLEGAIERYLSEGNDDN